MELVGGALVPNSASGATDATPLLRKEAVFCCEICGVIEGVSPLFTVPTAGEAFVTDTAAFLAVALHVANANRHQGSLFSL